MNTFIRVFLVALQIPCGVNKVQTCLTDDINNVLVGLCHKVSGQALLEKEGIFYCHFLRVHFHIGLRDTCQTPDGYEILLEAKVDREEGKQLKPQGAQVFRVSYRPSLALQIDLQILFECVKVFNRILILLYRP